MGKTDLNLSNLNLNSYLKIEQPIKNESSYAPVHKNDNINKLDQFRCELELSLPFQGRVRVDVKHSVMTVLADEAYDEFYSLLNEKEMKLPKMLTKITLTNPSAIAESLIKVFEKRTSAGTFLKEIVGELIKNTSDSKVIFRSNTLAAKAFEYFLKLTCLPHLHKMLKPIITDMYKGKKCCEMETSRVDEKSLKKNRANLIDLCEQVVNGVCESKHYLPMKLRSIFEVMKQHLKNQFPNDENIVYLGVSSFLFLRFICPAILSPALFGLSNEHPRAKVARDLTLLAKTIQVLANLTTFTAKDSSMCDLNDFITSKQKVLKAFLDEITGRPSDTIDEIPSTHHTRINFGKEMSFLVQNLEENLGALEEAFPNDEMVGRLKAVLEKLNLSISENEGKPESKTESKTETKGESKGTNTESPRNTQINRSKSAGPPKFVITSRASPVSYEMLSNLDVPDTIPDTEKCEVSVTVLQETLVSLKKRYAKLQAKFEQLSESHKTNETVLQNLAKEISILAAEIADTENPGPPPSGRTQNNDT
uniref:Ras-GAP domain-containing protein n=1 Tax=Arcella intermedia TaxID=1963864 RepID=A0A6B2L190_9EUKA